ncbi:hypothetical protein [Levilactobacillus zymae]|uniref:hypothetical protein n=1 Tax=Levilactobacillus zymae TaxID=267363 RepID=UPI0028BBAC15|nr:hypothetical protein [Levilactobacillus zymae]MDT6980191.1 hypothetical protein [Levilactobacillus zymae]
MPNTNQPDEATRAKIRRKKFKAKVGDEIWDRYARSVKNGILTQKEADAAMLVEHKKAVTKKNRERKAKGPKPKSKKVLHREHAQKRAAKEWAERKHATGHRARRQMDDYADPATYQLNRRPGGRGRR